MEKRGSTFWDNLVKKVNKIKPLTLSLDESPFPDLKAKFRPPRRRPERRCGVLDSSVPDQAEGVIRYPDRVCDIPEETEDEEEDVCRIGNKPVVMTDKKTPAMAPLARLESDFDAVSCAKRKTAKSKPKVVSVVCKLKDLDNDRLEVVKNRLRSETLNKINNRNDRLVKKTNDKIDNANLKPLESVTSNVNDAILKVKNVFATVNFVRSREESKDGWPSSSPKLFASSEFKYNKNYIKISSKTSPGLSVFQRTKGRQQFFRTIPEINSDENDSNSSTISTKTSPANVRRSLICCNEHKCRPSCYRSDCSPILKRTVATNTDSSEQQSAVQALESATGGATLTNVVSSPAKEIWVNDVATLTERTLSDLYVPFEAVRGILIKQARDILLCRFCGDYLAFRDQFLEPAAQLLRRLVHQHDLHHRVATGDLGRRDAGEGAASGAFPATLPGIESIRGGGDYEECQLGDFSTGRQCLRRGLRESERRKTTNSPDDNTNNNCRWRGWPLCYDRRLLLHLGELDSGVQRRGDFYFYLRATTKSSKSDQSAGRRRGPLSSLVSSEPSEPCVDAPIDFLSLTLRYRDQSGSFQDKTVSDYPAFLEIMEWSCESDYSDEVDVSTTTSAGSSGFGESDDLRVSSVLRNLLVAVERGIERLEWDKMKVTTPPTCDKLLRQTPGRRCDPVRSNIGLRLSVDTRDCSVQTSPTEELERLVGAFQNDAKCLSTDPKDTDPEQVTRDQNSPTDSKSSDPIDAVANSTCVSTSTSKDDTTGTQNPLDSSRPTSRPELVEVAGEDEEDDGYYDNTLSQPTTVSQVDQDLLHSQIALLPGSRDKCGRSVVYLFLGKLGSVDKNIKEFPSKLAEFLVYFGMIPKSEVSKKGLVILVDCSRANVESWTTLDEAFSLFEAHGGSTIHSVFLWLPPNDPVKENGSPNVTEEFAVTPFPNSALKYEVLRNQDELLKLIPRDQLLKEFGGTYAYDHTEWIGFRKFLEPFVNGCRLSGRHLVSVMRDLNRGVSHLPLTNASATRKLIERQKRHIHSTYQDEQLRHLEEEGDTILRELRHYSAGAPHNQDYQDALEHSAALYGELRRAMNKLSKLAERRMKKLEECLHIKTLAEESSQVLSWLCRRGEESLAKHQMVAESLPAIKEQEEEFEKFYFLAMRQIEKGNDLLEEAALVNPSTTPSKHNVQSHKSTPETKDNKKNKPEVNSSPESANVQDLTSSLKQRLNSFSERLEETRERLEDTAKCYHLLDEVYEWALGTMNFVSEMKLDRVTSSAADYEDIIRWTKALDDYLDDHPPIADEVFREMTLLAKAASSGSSQKLLHQCQTAQARCQETVELVRARRSTLLEAGRSLAPDTVRLRRDSSSSDGQQQQKDWDPLPNPNKTTRSRSHPQNFWPRGSSTPSTSSSSGSGRNVQSVCSEDGFDSPSNFFRHQSYTRYDQEPQPTNRTSLNTLASIRRRSMSAISGPPAGFSSPFASYTSFPSNSYPVGPLSTPRDCALQMDQYLRDKEEQLQSRGLITEDLTTIGPVATIEKDDSRWSHNSGNSGAPLGEEAISGSSSVNVPLQARSSTGSRLATKGSPPPTTSNSSLHPVTQKPVKKHMRICPTWQLCEEALQKAAQQVRRQNERLGNQRKVDEDNEDDDELACSRFPDETSATNDSIPTDEIQKGSGVCPATSNLDGPIPVNSHLLQLDISNGTDQDTPDSFTKNKNIKQKTTLMLIMGELIQTERDYVKSLEYIIENYCPELLREDIPQALRGQRNVIFGNIEKIYEFHSQYFLQELELCETLPFRVGQYFLQYERQFYLYALYNKNKPKSDNLMSEYGTKFFRRKQLELKDKMDLASYLLKPVQRMGKYALLLKQLLKECPEVEKESEHQDLKAAEEMVRFQLRHGNDLLAMDALRDCDVNVKEQGRLLRQDEFLVWQGRYRKSLRRVFLFEDLILFSKARRDPDQRGLQEIYQYKQSIKTTDIGMTEQIGDSPTKFEIWFRKRKLHDTYILQAASSEVKLAWAHEISRLLWKQALKNREIRLAEMSSMGIGNKPCLDIKPSEDQINDRSIRIDSVPKANRLRNSIAVSSSFDQLRTNKRPHSIISVSSSSSSGSSCGNNNVPGTGFSFFGAALNLGFEAGDSPRSHHRSVTQQSQCSTESGFCTDTSLMGEILDCDSNLKFGQLRSRRKAERSDSVLSNDSITTQPPSEEFEPGLPDLTETESVPLAQTQSQESVNTPM